MRSFSVSLVHRGVSSARSPSAAPVCGALVLSMIAGVGCRTAPGPAANAELRASSEPYLALDAREMDRSARPAEDFWRYANGGWLDSHPIPADQASWNTFGEIDQRVDEQVRAILDDAAADARAKPGSNRRLVGDAWCACMDEARVDAVGIAPLAPLFARIDAIASAADVPSVLGALHRQGVGAAFALFATQDPKDATRTIAWLWQDGLGLPDRDYYTRDDDASRELRAKYVAHVQRTFALAGSDAASAARAADVALRFETRLAKASMTNVELRDPNATYHLLSLPELETRWRGVSLQSYLDAVGYADLALFNVGQPAFFEEVAALVVGESSADWKLYLRWHVLRQLSDVLAQPFQAEHFDFYGRTLAGREQQEPRWRRCVAHVNGALGEAVGSEYVARHFPPSAKQKALQMVADLTQAFRERIATRDWMGARTKEEARKKLDAIAVKVGYPDRWRDYSKLALVRDSFAANVLASNAFDFRYQMDKVGKPVDRSEWGMSPQTVNAYYNPSLNEIVFPAAILQHPFFDERADDALNYGGMGAVIGHELTHGFDDEGSQYDAQGNLRSWWTPEDRAEFERRAAHIAAQYDGYSVEDGLNVNGKLTLGENLADLGGVAIGLHALELALARGGAREPIDGLSPRQRFFVAWARGWRENIRPEAQRMKVHTNPHAPNRFRALGPLVNVPEFASAFPSTGVRGFGVGEPRASVEIW